MKVGIEHGASRDLVNALARRGHKVQTDSDLTDYGRGQIILRDPVSGVLCGGDRAADGFAYRRVVSR